MSIVSFVLNKRQKNNVGQPVPAFESFTGASIAANTKPVASNNGLESGAMGVVYSEPTISATTSTAIESAAQ